MFQTMGYEVLVERRTLRGLKNIRLVAMNAPAQQSMWVCRQRTVNPARTGREQR
jgi:hypothetical protein